MKALGFHRTKRVSDVSLTKSKESHMEKLVIKKFAGFKDATFELRSGKANEHEEGEGLHRRVES